jgi:hypothetical protein
VKYSLVHKSDALLSHDTPRSIFREDTQTAEALGHIAEFDARKLYRPAGYDSMHEYLVQACNRSEDVAYDRVQAARCARDFPAIFELLAEGRLHLAGILMLAPHLTPQKCRRAARGIGQEEQTPDRGHAGGALSQLGSAALGDGHSGSEIRPGPNCKDS